MMFCDGKQNKSNKKESGIRKARKPCNLALLYIYNTFFILAFVFVVSEKKKLATNFLDLATTFENLGARCLLEKKS